MRLSQRVEMAVTGRKPSTTPAEAVCVLLGIETRTEAQEQRFAEEAHWAYGTAWGLGQVPLRRIAEPARTLLYVATVWTAGVALITGLRLAPPPTKWSPASLVADLMHHLVYAAAAGLTFAGLERRRQIPQLLSARNDWGSVP